MSFSALISKMSVLFLYICIGLLCGKTGIVNEEGSRLLNKLVLFICSPALILHAVLDSELTYSVADILYLLLFGLVFMLLMLLFGFVCTRLFRCKAEERGLMNLVISFGNVAFMGFPVITAMYGSGAVFLGSVCTIPFNILIFSVGALLIVGKKKNGLPIRKVITNPSLIATAVSFVIFLLDISFPAPVEEAIGGIAGMVIPLSMLLIGTSLSRMSPRAVLLDKRCYIVSLCKLIVLPLGLAACFRFLVHDPLFYGVFVILSCMPSATMAPVLCGEYGGNTQFASSCVFITTLFSLATVPIMLYLILL
ncbi:MAG: AEC family transporter [Ruminococcaceae bacterium]|nr:AEC family transporter [Oscillospiraceae bacterium]